MPISGVYFIKSLTDQRYYIGSSNNIKARFTRHKRVLKNGEHHNRHLQRCFYKYGFNNFVFSIVLKTNETFKYEQIVLDRLRKHGKKVFNQCRVVNNPTSGIKLSENQKKKCSRPGSKNGMFGVKHKDNALEIMRDCKRGPKNPAWKGPIHKVDLKSGNILKTYFSQKEIKSDNHHASCVYQTIAGKNPQHHGFGWVRLWQ